MAQRGRARRDGRLADTAEGRRLEEVRSGVPWRRWGPYVSDRQWGTVREDYSPYGTAWEYFPHDHARSRAYRWGEDGIAGFGDEHLYLCLGLALWNERDPILKERFFGLTNSEGNHGEDVKELYYYLDGTPTHSYMRMLYKYPQMEFPYNQIAAENRRRGMQETEFEILDSGIFDKNCYFDIEVEYAKGGIDDILMLVTVHNRGDARAPLHVLPHLWARNIWSWEDGSAKPLLSATGGAAIVAEHRELPSMTLLCDGSPDLLFCENETNPRRMFSMNAHGYFKDGINDYIVHGERGAVNPDRVGTKAAAHYRLDLAPGASTQLRLRLISEGGGFDDFAATLRDRRAEADEFYETLQHDMDDPDARLVQRQAFAGMLWSKQFYCFFVREWLQGDPLQPPPPESRWHVRNTDWGHVYNFNVVSMPDKWEYPWYAAWDLAFHCVTLALIDPEFAKAQLVLLTREWYMHPNGQLPAYEWAFGDVNPPVHAWAAWRVYEIDREQRGGEGDREFLERVYHKLMINFTWWVNRKDAEGRNIFQGGFLGLDNIGIFDRSAQLPTGGFISQSDGTAWMAMYALNLMRIALELAPGDHVYEDIATKFFEHFLLIAEAMTNMGGEGIGLWDEADEFYYDVLHLPDDERVPLRVRSMVGLIPFFAVEVLDGNVVAQLPGFSQRLHWFLDHRPELARLVSRWQESNEEERHLLSLLRGHRMKRLLYRMLDESEFLSDFGVRSLSKYHERNPFVFEHAGNRFSIGYVPGESSSGTFGGNSNWRGPIWMPVNFLLIESLHRFYAYYGDDFLVEYPTGSGTKLTLLQIADELARRLTRVFLADANGHRPVFGGSAVCARPEFRDNVLFYEYFHGDTGRGLGAAHQTGWTGLIALLLRPRSEPEPGAAATRQEAFAELAAGAE
jgi:Mannosylglycerate hydrolase MGH1-like glycoside hydrolase domain/Glycosyl hydrolase family 63 C-terminal domain